MIIYIHGFGGSGMSSKATALRQELKAYNFIAPSLSHIPELAIETLKELIRSTIVYENIYLIGSSLGGYYATYLAEYFNIPAVLINPVVNPQDTLRQFLGKNNNSYDNSVYEWNNKHLKMLKAYKIKNIKPELYFILLQLGDELLDCKEAIEKYTHVKSIILDGGSHKYENIEQQIEDVKQFLQINTKK